MVEVTRLSDDLIDLWLSESDDEGSLFENRFREALLGPAEIIPYIRHLNPRQVLIKSVDCNVKWYIDSVETDKLRSLLLREKRNFLGF